MSKFKEILNFKSKTLEERKLISKKLIKENNLKIPVLMCSFTNSFKLKKINYLIPKKYKMHNILFLLKSQNEINQNSQDSFYIYANEKIIRYDIKIEEIYSRHKDNDGFLYLQIHSMPTFGN